MKRKKLTKSERDAFEAARTRADVNARRLRELAELALAKLDSEDPHRPTLRPSIPRGLNGRDLERATADADARWLRELAERAQAELDAQRPGQ